MEILTLHRQFRRYCAIEEGLGPRTVRAMESEIKTFVKRSGAVLVGDMTLGRLKEFFYEGRERYQWSYWAYANHHKYLKKFLAWCMKHQHLKENPLLEIGLPRKPQKLPRRLSFDEAQRVLYASFNCNWSYDFERSRNHAIVATLLYTGLRSQELLNLEISDIDMEGSTMLVRSGKGNKDRYVPLHHKLRYILRRYLSDRRRLHKEAFWLFTGVRSTKPLCYKDLCRICRRISVEAGIKFTPHQLRHTFASVSIDQGMGLMQVKEILGHSNIASTMIYVKLSSRNLSEGLNRIALF